MPLQVIPVDEAVPRGEFYHEHNIAMVARPAQNRRGVFKKASNLNYQLAGAVEGSSSLAMLQRSNWNHLVAELLAW